MLQKLIEVDIANACFWETEKALDYTLWYKEQEEIKLYSVRRIVLIRNAPLHSISLWPHRIKSANALRWTELISAGGRKSVVDDSLTPLAILL